VARLSLGMRTLTGHTALFPDRIRYGALAVSVRDAGGREGARLEGPRVLVPGPDLHRVASQEHPPRGVTVDPKPPD
jgi:hypothetical protein